MLYDAHGSMVCHVTSPHSMDSYLTFVLSCRRRRRRRRRHPEAAPSECDLLLVLVPRVHGNHVQDGGAVEESHLPGLHAAAGQVAHLVLTHDWITAQNNTFYTHLIRVYPLALLRLAILLAIARRVHRRQGLMHAARVQELGRVESGQRGGGGQRVLLSRRHRRWRPVHGAGHLGIPNMGYDACLRASLLFLSVVRGIRSSSSLF